MHQFLHSYTYSGTSYIHTWGGLGEIEVLLHELQSIYGLEKVAKDRTCLFEELAQIRR